jgi:hypothetical protein
MDDFVKIEYRGIFGHLPVGATATVESCEAGMLCLRVIGQAPLSALEGPSGIMAKWDTDSQDEPKKDE